MPFAGRGHNTVAVSFPESHESRVPKVRWRWIAVGLFMLSSSVNYLDRGLLAALAPTLRQEFGLSNLEYGHIPRKLTIPFGLGAQINSARNRISIPESAVV